MERDRQEKRDELIISTMEDYEKDIFEQKAVIAYLQKQLDEFGYMSRLSQKLDVRSLSY